MSNRKVCYTATIFSKALMKGKDRIAYFALKDLKWRVISSIDLNPGDKVVYCEYDTVIDGNQAWAVENVSSRCYSMKYNGFRIRVMKIGDFASYGLIIPIKDIKCSIDLEKVEDGYDLSELLGVKSVDSIIETKVETKKQTRFQRFCKKYLYFIWKRFFKEISKGSFPSHLMVKTDETRIQNLSETFIKNSKDLAIDVTEKIDGQSATFIFHNNLFYVCSRNTVIYKNTIKKAIKDLTSEKVQKNSSNSYLQIACKYDLPKLMFHFCKTNSLTSIGMQGEIAGPGIQKNRLGLEEKELYVFNVSDIDKKTYFSYDEISRFCLDTRTKQVPKINIHSFQWDTIDEIENAARGFYKNGHPREGIVIRAHNKVALQEPIRNTASPIWSFKVINEDFILKTQE